MAERYKRLNTLAVPQAQHGAPILLTGAALLGDTQTGRVLAQLKLQNIAGKRVAAVFAEIVCTDAMGEKLSKPVEAKYMDLSVNPGTEFGERVPVMIPDSSVRDIGVRIVSVRYEDCSAWKAEDGSVLQPIAEPENRLSPTALEQLRYEIGGDRIRFATSPIVYDGRVRCACGQWNTETNTGCVHCGSDLRRMLETADEAALNVRYDKRRKAEAEAERQKLEEQRKHEEAARIERERKEKEEARRAAKLAAEQAARRKKLLMIAIPIAAVVLIAVLVFCFVIRPEQLRSASYAEAVQLLENRQYDEAEAAFTELGSYKDSAKLISRIGADRLYDAGDLKGALAVYDQLDEKYRIHSEDYAAQYATAVSCMESGEYDRAIELLTQIEGYPESADRLLEARYEKAAAQQTAGDFAAAQAGFEALGDYSDAATRVLQVQADAMYAAGDPAGANALYAELGTEYQSNAAGYSSEYAAAEQLLLEGRYDEAAAAFEALGGYSDAADRVSEARYAAADAAWQIDDAAQAQTRFAELGDYRDSAARTEQAAERVAELSIRDTADGLYDAGDLAGAWEQYALLDISDRTHEADYAQLYTDCLTAVDEERFEEAAVGFERLGGYSDATEQARLAYRNAADRSIAGADYADAERIYRHLGDTVEADRVAAYAKAVALEQNGEYIPARDAYVALETYLDSDERAEACRAARYAQAEQLYADGDIAGAHIAWVELADYSDSAERAAEIEALYESGVAKLAAADYDGAIEAFTALANYADSEDRKTLSIYEKAGALAKAGSPAEALDIYEALGDYRDSATQAEALHEQLADAAFESGEYAIALDHYLRCAQIDALKEKEYRLAQTCYDSGEYEQATRAYEGLGAYELSMSRLPTARYSWAAQLCETGRYAEAAEQFALLGDYSDSAAREKESRYLNAQALLEAAQYDEAKAAFAALGGYSDSADKAKQCDYRRAVALADSGKLEEARALFKALGTYNDSGDRYNDCGYRMAEAAMQTGAIEEAQAGFEALGTFSDSADRVKQCIALRAQTCFDAGEYEAAQELYDRIPGYADADEQAQRCRYLRAQAAITIGDEETAIRLLDELGDYQDSEVLLAGIRYGRGKALLQQGDTEAAIRELSLATVLPETKELLYGIGKDKAAVNDLQGAIETLWLVTDYEPASVLLRELGSVLEMNGDTLTAFEAYSIAGDEESANRLSVGITAEQLDAMSFGAPARERGIADDMRYRLAGCRNATGDYAGAYALYATLSGYRDADTIIETDENIAAAAAAAAAHAAYVARFDVGKTVTFGSYGGEPIEWLVLEAKDDTRIMITVKGQDAVCFNKNTSVGNAWETSYVRSWLNGTFYEEAFSEEEKAQLTTGVTGDRVYLLSVDEAKSYFGSDDARVCYPTETAKKNGVYTNSAGACWWWLRSPGCYSALAADVSRDGSVDSNGSDVLNGSGAVRPVVSVRLL